MKKVIYLHGFNSGSKKSQKVLELEHLFGIESVYAPLLPISPIKAIEQVSNYIKNNYQENQIVLCGTSLGGFYSLYLSQKFDIPCFVMNPVLEPHKRKTFVGTQKRYETGEVYEFTTDNLSELETLLKIQNNWEALNSNFHFYLAKDDEILNFDKTLELLNTRYPYKHLKVYDTGGHRFSNYKEVFDDIQKLN